MTKGLFRAFHRCHKTWKEGIAGFRNDLIETSQRWEELGFSGTCPFPAPTTDEIREYKRGLDSFESRRDLEQLFATTFYSRYGCMPPAMLGVAQLIHRKQLDCTIQEIREKKETEEALEGGWLSDLEELREVWPFDVPADWCPPEVGTVIGLPNLLSIVESSAVTRCH
jgi:hypothetical protein